MIFLSVGCASPGIKTTEGHLSDKQIYDLMDHPKKWNGQVVTIKIFPFDNGFSTSYLVCFEKCDEKYATRSPFIILTSLDRFKGYNGQREVVVTAKYDSSCFYTDAICADNRFGEFTEIPKD